MTGLGEAIKKARTKLNIQRRIAYLGDGSGEVHDREIPGQYLVRFPQGSDALGAPVSLPLDVNANLPATDGLTVEIGERNGKPIILGAYYEGLTASAVNPLQLNPVDEPANKFINQDQITTFFATAHADSTNFPFYAVVFPGFFRVGSTLSYFAGSQVDLSSFVPASPDHCYAVVLIKTDGTLEAFASTAQDASDPLTTDDIQEALNSATAGSIPVRAWELMNDDTTLTVDPARQVDIREMVGGRTLTSSDIPAHAHNIHTGLTTGDDHTQYFLLAGRAGGQTAYGGAAASENLTLNSTAHATKGNVLIGGSTLRIDEALTTVGIKGAAVSAQALTIYTGADANKGLQIRQNSASQSANLFEVTNSTGATILGKIQATGELVLTPSNTTSTTGGVSVTQTQTNPAGGTYSFNKITANISLSGNSLAAQDFYALNATIATASDAIVYSTAQVRSFFLSATHNGSGTISAMFGGYANVVNAGSGIITSAIGFQPQIRNTGAGSISAAYGINIPTPIISAGSINSIVGLSIQNISGATTTNYAIQTNAGNIVFNEGGDSATDVRTEGVGDQYLLFTKSSTARVAVGNSAPDTKFHVTLDNATTNAIDNVVTIEHSSTGTPAAGFGSGLLFTLESSTTTKQSAGLISASWVVATHASRTSRMVLSAYDTAVREGVRIEASGTAPMLGFFGANAVVKPTALTTALTTITHTAPGTPDYAIQDFTQTSPWGFADHDEANSVLKVIANLQTRTNELETKLQALGLLT